MKKMLLICALSIGILSNCASTSKIKLEDFNFQNSTELARYQTAIYDKYRAGEKIPKEEIKSMKNNIWVATAEHVAPGNLVIRQYCLLDLLEGNSNRKYTIERLVRCLSYNGTIWAEGYHYWLYTRAIMDEWIRVFSYNPVIDLVYNINKGFLRTSYMKEGLLYPAPFGDLKHIPLETALQTGGTYGDTTIGIVSVKRAYYASTYDIKALPLGLNHHIPKEDSRVEVINGSPVDFNFYTSIDDKYKTKQDEIMDLMDKRRTETIGKCD